MTSRSERAIRSEGRYLNREIYQGILQHYKDVDFWEYKKQVDLQIHQTILDAMILGYAVERKRLQRSKKLSLKARINRLLDPGEYDFLQAQMEWHASTWSAPVRSDISEIMSDWIKISQMQSFNADQAARGLHILMRAKGYSKVTARNVRNVLGTVYNMGLEGAKYSETANNPEVWGYRWQTAGDERVRESHVAMQGTTLPKNHPFWSKVWPPIDWNCRCSIEVLTEEENIVEPPHNVPVAPKFVGNPFKEFHMISV